MLELLPLSPPPSRTRYSHHTARGPVVVAIKPSAIDTESKRLKIPNPGD